MPPISTPRRQENFKRVQSVITYYFCLEIFERPSPPLEESRISVSIPQAHLSELLRMRPCPETGMLQYNIVGKASSGTDPVRAWRASHAGVLTGRMALSMDGGCAFRITLTAGPAVVIPFDEDGR